MGRCYSCSNGYAMTGDTCDTCRAKRRPTSPELASVVLDDLRRMERTATGPKLARVLERIGEVEADLQAMAEHELEMEQG